MHEKLSVYSIAIALVVLPASSSSNESCWFGKFCVYRREHKQTKRMLSCSGKVKRTLIHRCNVIFIMKNPNNVERFSCLLLVFTYFFFCISFWECVSTSTNISFNQISLHLQANLFCCNLWVIIPFPTVINAE